MDEKNNPTNSAVPSDSQGADNEVRVDLSGGQSQDPVTTVNTDLQAAASGTAAGLDNAQAAPESGTAFAPNLAGTPSAEPATFVPTPAAEVGQAATESAGVMPPQPAADQTAPVAPFSPEQPTAVPSMVQPNAPMPGDPAAAVPPLADPAAPQHHDSKMIVVLAGVAVLLLAVIAVLYFVM